MRLPIAVVIKNFLGLYVMTPFEKELLKQLSEAMLPSDREILDFQFAHFTTVRRLLKHVDVSKAHGFTNFYTMRFGNNLTDKCQIKRFEFSSKEVLMATAYVTFDGGEINVEFWLVSGVLFSIEYYSPQNIYYPSGNYSIRSIEIWPKAGSKNRS